jgi:endogenous inhibitor of DNA gyrase (YacG/DUF329 family)
VREAKARPAAALKIRAREVFVICPTCKRTLPTSPERNAFRPFCSDRCRLADLGAWLDGAHRISSPLSEDDSDEVLRRKEEDEKSGPN